MCEARGEGDQATSPDQVRGWWRGKGGRDADAASVPASPLISIVLTGALIGVLYGDLHHGAPIIGGCVGGAMGASFFSLERFVLRRNSGWLFGRLPFLPYLALRTALYAAVIFVVNAIAIMLASGRFMTVGSVDFLSSFLVVVAFNLLFSVNDLLGPGVLFAFAAGRYYHPRIEERALLFIDMRSSTRSPSASANSGFSICSTASSPMCRSPSRRPAAKFTNMSATR